MTAFLSRLAPSRTALPPRAGLGLKPEHMRDILADEGAADLGFFEVHAENYMVEGGAFHQHLAAIRERHALSVHGVGLSIGAEAPPDRDHLKRLRALLERYQPEAFSEHLAWSSHGRNFYNDLLPLPYTDATLHRVCAHIDAVQSALGRRMLLENPATYIEFTTSTWDEAEFIAEVVRRSGCGLLLDVNNAHVSAVNHGRDVQAYLQRLPLTAVGEIHLAGFAEERDAAGERLLIDSHGAPVADAVWHLFQQVIQSLGPLPTLIERDQNIPPFAILMGEARAAQALLDDARSRQPHHLRETV